MFIEKICLILIKVFFKVELNPQCSWIETEPRLIGRLLGFKGFIYDNDHRIDWREGWICALENTFQYRILRRIWNRYVVIPRLRRNLGGLVGNVREWNPVAERLLELRAEFINDPQARIFNSTQFPIPDEPLELTLYQHIDQNYSVFKVAKASHLPIVGNIFENCLRHTSYPIDDIYVVKDKHGDFKALLEISKKVLRQEKGKQNSVVADHCKMALNRWYEREEISNASPNLPALLNIAYTPPAPVMQAHQNGVEEIERIQAQENPHERGTQEFEMFEVGRAAAYAQSMIQTTGNIMRAFEENPIAQDAVVTPEEGGEDEV